MKYNIYGLMKIEFGNIVTLEYSNGRLPVLMLQAICLMAFDKTECFGHFRILVSLFRCCIEIISDIYKWCRTCDRRQSTSLYGGSYTTTSIRW